MVDTFKSFAFTISNRAQSVSFSLVFMLFSISVSATQIDVTVDRNPVIINESFQVVFTATEPPDDDPDFSPLRQKFDIVNQQKSSQLSWINGNSSKSIQWVLSLMAKQTGEQVIPAISFGDDASKPRTITVKTIHSNSSGNVRANDELFLDVDVTPGRVYVQGQIIYTVRFYQRVSIAQATLTDPDVDNSVVEKLADDVTFNTQIKGVNYRVTERKYAIFPQNSGTLIIPPLVLTAQVLINDPRDRFNSFFSTQSTQTKRVVSKPITLDVLASPSKTNGDRWLPAEDVQLQQSWSNDDLQVQVGEPITRTLTIVAKGVLSSQLPDLAVQSISSNVKVYPDQAKNEDKKNANGITAIREQKIAFIPSSTGDFKLPAITIPWFNTKTQKMEVAKLPVVNLHVIAPENQITKGPNRVVDSEERETQAPIINTDDELIESKVNIWMITTFAFGFVWLMTIYFGIRSRFNKVNNQQEMGNERPVKLNKIIKDLESACMENNSHDAYKSLRSWGQLIFNTTNIDTISSYCDHDLQAEILKLNQCEYSQKNLNWDGKMFWNRFKSNSNKQHRDTSNSGPLTSLNRL